MKNIRDILRQAERAFGDPAVEADLRVQGIELGETEVLSGPELLALLETGETASTPSLTVTVFFEDTPVNDRGEIEDPLSELMEGQGIGEWTGSGQGQIGSRRFFDITYSVSDTTEALLIIQEHLRKLGAGPSTELSTSDGTVYRLG